MNCADSVLNSDELPVRGIDQCPSTLSTQWDPGLVLDKWNRLLALFKRTRLNSCFVEAEAFLKCVNLLCFKGAPFFPPSFQRIWCCSFCEYFAIFSPGCFCLCSKARAHSCCLNRVLNLYKEDSGSRSQCLAAHKTSNSSWTILEVCGVEATGPCLTFKRLLPTEGGLGQPVYTDHSFRPLRTTGTDHWASLAAPTGTADSQLPPATALKLTSRLITGGSSLRASCSQMLTTWQYKGANEWKTGA